MTARDGRTRPMEERTAVVTGANRGLGFHVARRLANLGARVILLCRDPERGREAAEEIREDGSGLRVELAVVDLASFSSIQDFAGAPPFEGPLHVLVNNAAVVPQSARAGDQGHDLQWTVNHLAPYLLTRLLLPRLRAGAPARIVNVSSNTHRIGRLDRPAERGRRYQRRLAYADSKLANLVVTRSLAERLEGSGVTANAVRPGTLGTGLLMDLLGPLLAPLRLLLPGPERGAEPLVRACVDPALAGVSGRYFDRFRDEGPAAEGVDREARERLWRESARAVGLDPDLP